jgi:hypothetical protein
LLCHGNSFLRRWPSWSFISPDSVEQ